MISSFCSWGLGVKLRQLNCQYLLELISLNHLSNWHVIQTKPAFLINSHFLLGTSHHIVSLSDDDDCWVFHCIAAVLLHGFELEIRAARQSLLGSCRFASQHRCQGVHSVCVSYIRLWWKCTSISQSVDLDGHLEKSCTSSSMSPGLDFVSLVWRRICLKVPVIVIVTVIAIVWFCFSFKKSIHRWSKK